MKNFRLHHLFIVLVILLAVACEVDNRIISNDRDVPLNPEQEFELMFEEGLDVPGGADLLEPVDPDGANVYNQLDSLLQNDFSTSQAKEAYVDQWDVDFSEKLPAGNDQIHIIWILFYRNFKRIWNNQQWEA